MPLATNPNATYEIVLSTDAGLPKEKQPVFIFRYLSVTEWEIIAKISDEFETLTEAPQMIDSAFKIIKKSLCGWKNMKNLSGGNIPFNIKKLKSMVTLPEATELMQAGVLQRPTVMDKKN